MWQHSACSRAVVTCMVLAIAPVSVSAQRLEDARLGLVRTVAPDQSPQERTVTRKRVLVMRTITGAVGATIGGYTGYLVGRKGDPHDANAWSLSDQEFTGALIGLLIGAAVGVTLKDYESACGWPTRLVRALPGAAVGLLPGVIIGPFGPGLGAAVAQGRC